MEASVCNSILSFSNCHVCAPSFTNVPKHSLVAATSFRSKSFLKLSLRGYSSAGAQRSDSTGRRWNVRAAQDEDGVDSEVSTSTSQTPIPGSDKRAKAKAEQEKGQNTARVTGAVAVLLGVAYLVLVQLLDTRGRKRQTSSLSNPLPLQGFPNFHITPDVTFSSKFMDWPNVLA